LGEIVAGEQRPASVAGGDRSQSYASWAPFFGSFFGEAKKEQESNAVISTRYNSPV